MSAFPGSPNVVKGGIVLIDPDIGTVMRVIPLQYTPDTMTRSLQIRGAGEPADHTEALRLTGPPIETIKVEVEFDATDQRSEEHTSELQSPYVISYAVS